MEFHSLLEAAARCAENTPDRVCLIEVDAGRSVTYGELWRHIRIVAARILSAGLRKGDRVVVRVGPFIETIVAQFGIYLAGGVYCPVEKNMKAPKMLEMLGYYDSSLLISSERISSGGRYMELNSMLDDGEPLENFIFPTPDDLCAIIFTTGTTGKAKGVMHSFRSSLAYTEFLCDMHGKIAEGEAHLWTYALDRVGGIIHIGYAFICEGTSVHCNAYVFAKDFFDAVVKYNAVAMTMAANTLSILLNVAPEAFAGCAAQVRSINYGGGSLPVKDKLKLQKLLPETRLFNSYGSTEINLIAYNEISRYGDRAHCVGKIWGGIEVGFVDEAGNPISASAKNPGVITLGNINYTMLGYWKAPELSAQTLKENRIVMTDMGYMDEDGLLYLVGRKDDVIVSGGHKIAPYEIEDIAAQIPGVEECACVPSAHNMLGQIPVLYVVIKDGVEFSAKKIYEMLALRMETFKLPRSIRQLDALPRTTDGLKINRKALAEYE